MKFDRVRKAYLVAGTPYALDVMDALSIGLRRPEEISKKAGVPECRVMAVVRRLREAGLVRQDLVMLTPTGAWLHATALDLESHERNGKRIVDGEGGGAEGVAE